MGDFIFHNPRKSWILLGLIILVFWGQGCQLQDEMAPLSTSICVQSSIDRSFEEMTFMPDNWIREDWWEMFGDDQLNSMTQVALQNNPTLKMAIERVSLARDCAKNAFAPLLPEVDAAVEDFLAAFTWNQRGVGQDAMFFPDRIVPRWINFLSTLLHFRWRLDIWGSQKKLYKAAIDDTKMQLAEAVYAKLMLSTQLASSYFDYQYYLAMQEQQQQMACVQKQVLEIQNQMYQHALCNETHLQMREKSILQIEKDLLDTQYQLEQTEHQLKALMGFSADSSFILETPTSNFGHSFPFPKELPINLLLRRPDVIAKIWAVQAAQKRVNSAQVAFLPTIDLGSFSGYLNLNWDTLIKPRGWFTSIIPMASLPLFQGLKLKTNLNMAVRRYNHSVHEYNQMLLNAAKEVVDALSAFRISNEQLKVHEQILDKSENIKELAQLRFEIGLNSYLDVLNTIIDVQQDEIAQLNVQRMHLLATLNLIKSIGGGYEGEDIVITVEEQHTE